MKMSHHVIDDRMDRFMFIATEIGWGNEILEVLHYDVDGRESLRVLTDSGVIIVKSTEKANTIVTAFVANEQQAKEIFSANNYIYPDWMHRQVAKNQKKLPKEAKKHKKGK